MSDWKNNRPENWAIIKRKNCDEKLKLVGGAVCETCPAEPQTCNVDFEAGADAMYEAIMKQRPSNEGIRIKLVSCVYGSMEASELLSWLKDKLLVRED